MQEQSGNVDWFAKEETNAVSEALITPGATYPVWTPYADHAAAEQMLAALEASA